MNTSSDAFRDVTPEEIEHYRQNSWVKLDKFIPPDKVDALLAMARRRMGERGDRNLPPEAFSYFNPLTLRGLQDPLLRPLIDHCARGSRALMARRVPVGIRYFTDYLAVKQPTRSKQEARTSRMIRAGRISSSSIPQMPAGMAASPMPSLPRG